MVSGGRWRLFDNGLFTRILCQNNQFSLLAWIASPVTFYILTQSSSELYAYIFDAAIWPWAGWGSQAITLIEALNWVNIFLIYYEIIHPSSWQEYSIVGYICPCKVSISWVSAFHSGPNLIGFGVLSVAEISSDLSLRVYRFSPVCFHSALPSSTHMLYTLQKKVFSHIIHGLYYALPSVHIWYKF